MLVQRVWPITGCFFAAGCSIGVMIPVSSTLHSAQVVSQCYQVMPLLATQVDIGPSGYGAIVGTVPRLWLALVECAACAPVLSCVQCMVQLSLSAAGAFAGAKMVANLPAAYAQERLGLQPLLVSNQTVTT